MSELYKDLTMVIPVTEDVPRICYLYTPNATLAQVQTQSFLDKYLINTWQSLTYTDCIFTVASDGKNVLAPTFSNILPVFLGCKVTLVPWL